MSAVIAQTPEWVREKIKEHDTKFHVAAVERINDLQTQANLRSELVGYLEPMRLQGNQTATEVHKIGNMVAGLILFVISVVCIVVLKFNLH